MSQQAPEMLRDALRGVSTDMREALHDLTVVLEAEWRATHERDAAALNSAGARKQALLRQLEALDIERRHLLRAEVTAPAICEPEWTQIEQALRACQQLNQRNGKLVNRHLSQVRDALSILTGGGGDGRLYDQAGSVHPSLRSHALAQA